MKLLSLVFMLVLGVSTSKAQSAKEIFVDQVYPHLQNRCASCHGLSQEPLHASFDSDEAYKEAKPLVNYDFPESSPLWVRSHNGHCEKPQCSSQDPELLKTLIQWFSKEKDEAGLDPFKLVATAKVPVPKLNDANPSMDFDIEVNADISFRIQITRFSENYIYFSRARAKTGQRYISFDGFELRSKEMEPQSQNYAVQKTVIKPTNNMVMTSNFDQGYVLALLPDMSAQFIELSIHMDNFVQDLTRDQAKNLFEEGYFLPVVQSVLRPEAVKVYTGEAHSCALFDNNKVRCWGDNSSGQLGYGDRANRGDQPNEMGEELDFVDLGNMDVASMSLGRFFSCAVSMQGRVKCWGANGNGQLGYGDTRARGDNANEMGNNLPYVNLGPEKVMQLHSGSEYSCALFESGRIKCWGFNEEGQLGYGDTVDRGDNANEMGNNLPYVDLGSEKVLNVHLGFDHSCATLADYTAKCWGENDSGELGTGDASNRGDSPGEMGNNLLPISLGNFKVMKVMPANAHSCALSDKGELKCWGRNSEGQLGYEDTVQRGDQAGEMGNNLPIVDLGGKIEDFYVKESSSCAYLDTGYMKCWGANGSGQLGYGDRTVRGDNAGEMGDNLLNIDLGGPVKSFALGYSHVCGVLDSRQIKCWGENSDGELGYGDTGDRGDNGGEMGDALLLIDLAQILSFD